MNINRNYRLKHLNPDTSYRLISLLVSRATTITKANWQARGINGDNDNFYAAI